MRVCAYFPIGLIDYTNNGDVDDSGIEHGLEYEYFNYICNYDINNNDPDKHIIDTTLPEHKLSNITTDYSKLKRIAKEFLNNKK